MTYVRIAVVLTLLLFLWPLVSPAGPFYARLLASASALVVEGIVGLVIVLTWTLRRLAEVVFLRASGERLRAAARE